MSNTSTHPSVVVRGISMEYTTKDPKKKFGWTKYRALDDVSFVGYEGQSIGLFGQNGSGKSTLMRIIAGAEKPSAGDIRVKSQPVLMGVKAALQPRLSGAKNVKIGCLAMGMTPQEADEVFDRIVDLADIGEAIERPMNTYSSGQAARLRFAIGTVSRPEILIIDETLSTGDAAFAQRAEAQMKSMLGDAGTVFLVSHSVKQLTEVCSRGLWLHDGRLIADGEIDEIAKWYRRWASLKGQDDNDKADELIQGIRLDYEPPNIVFT